jgi:holo-[acyl-carrier protein] synthase
LIKGLGSDFVEIERIKKSVERHGTHFLNRILSQQEQDYCYQFQEPFSHIAGRFAAKEAIAKAMGTGIGALLSWLDIEIINDTQGKPIVTLSETARKRFQNPIIFLTISHSHDHALAVAIWT